MNLPAALAHDGPLEVTTPGVRITPLANGTWRVVGRSGSLLGHLEACDDGGFRAMRFSVRDRGYRMLGEFRSATAATDALRFG